MPEGRAELNYGLAKTTLASGLWSLTGGGPHCFFPSFRIKTLKGTRAARKPKLGEHFLRARTVLRNRNRNRSRTAANEQKSQLSIANGVVKGKKSVVDSSSGSHLRVRYTWRGRCAGRRSRARTVVRPSRRSATFPTRRPMRNCRNFQLGRQRPLRPATVR